MHGLAVVCDALGRGGAIAHLAEPVETSALRGRKRRAKTDREDARWLRELLTEGRLPESWIPPEHVRQWRTRARMRKTLVDERTAWHQRIRATLYHHGISGSPEHLSSLAGREFLAEQVLPIDVTERITIALEMIDLLEIQIARIETEIRKLARRQAGCKALMTLYGMGELTSLITLTELGDVSRMHASRQAVRCAGIEMLASNCTSCSGDFGMGDVAGVRDPLAAVLLDGGVERDPQAVAGVAVGGELVV